MTNSLSQEYSQEVIDVFIIGAGLSGINVAYRLKTECDQLKLKIVEARKRVGGTWDLFKYPGVRSDSDVETLGFPFRPWANKESIVSGDEIQQYIAESAKKFQLDKLIEFNSKVIQVNWNSSKCYWEIEYKNSEEKLTKTVFSKFLYGCTGYYNYEKAHRPKFKDEEKFRGPIIHPQFWPNDLDLKNKKVTIVGSGATAVTLVPNLAKLAKSVTMLQRSPTYIVSRPSIDPVTSKIKKILPKGLAHKLVRLKNTIYMTYVYRFAQKKPELVRSVITKMAKRELPKNIDVKKHFNPKYNPWDERLCLAPDGDFFKSFHSGKVFIETDEIEGFTDNGILLKSGKKLDSDIIISATGLELQILGGISLKKDGDLISPSDSFSYKGVLMSGIPNFAISLGYTNASWTLKCDLSARYVCRLINLMKKKKLNVVVPNIDHSEVQAQTLIDLKSNYIKRHVDILPKQGNIKPWKLYQNFFLDWIELNVKGIREKNLEFTK